MFNKRGLAAFTLAEILITVGIVGVIAAVTIPMLLVNYQNMQRATQVKKIYSEFVNATKRVVDDNNGSLMGVFIHNVYDPTKAFSQYLRINKTCAMGNATGPNKCFHSAFKYLNGTNYPSHYMTHLTLFSSGVVLENGMLVNFYGDGADSAKCTVDGLANVCNFVLIDINGLKQPNAVGMDIFSFVITQNSFIPTSSMHVPIQTCIYRPEAAWNGANNTGNVCARYLLLH